MLSHFGNALKARREKLGLSRMLLSRRLGISQGDLARIEGSAAIAHGRLLSTICDALNMSVEEMTLAAGVVPSWLERLMREDPKRVLEALTTTFGANVHASDPSDALAPVLSPPVLETQLGKLYKADCIALMQSLPDGEVDLVFADPPFNLGKDYGSSSEDSRSERAYMDWSCSWLQEAIRVLKPGGALFLYNIPKWNVRFAAWLTQYLEFRHWIAVDIKFSLPIRGRLYPSHYSLLYFQKGTRPQTFQPPRLPIEICRHCGGEIRDYGGYKDRMNPRGVNLTDVWTDLSPVRHSRFKRRKANELPLKLVDRVLDIATREGDLVLDPFGGSGTTYVAAELKRRRWIGCEIEDCSAILLRFKKLDREKEILEAIQDRINVLFTPDALELRRRNGHDSSRYRIGMNGVATRAKASQAGGLFDY